MKHEIDAGTSRQISNHMNLTHPKIWLRIASISWRCRVSASSCFAKLIYRYQEAQLAKSKLAIFE